MALSLLEFEKQIKKLKRRIKCWIRSNNESTDKRITKIEEECCEEDNVGLLSVEEDTDPKLGGGLNAATYEITNLGSPTTPESATTKGYVDNAVFSGDYPDLSNKPMNLSDFNNDENFVKQGDSIKNTDDSFGSKIGQIVTLDDADYQGLTPTGNTMYIVLDTGKLYVGGTQII